MTRSKICDKISGNFGIIDDVLLMARLKLVVGWLLDNTMANKETLFRLKSLKKTYLRIEEKCDMFFSDLFFTVI